MKLYSETPGFEQQQQQQKINSVTPLQAVSSYLNVLSSSMEDKLPKMSSATWWYPFRACNNKNAKEVPECSLNWATRSDPAGGWMDLDILLIFLWY